MENIKKTKPTAVLRHSTMQIPGENGGKHRENMIWDGENMSKRAKTRLNMMKTT